MEDNLLGAYLHGSLALGCFNPERSDIDLLVITKRQMTVETKRRIAEILLSRSAAPAPIEISFLPAACISPWRYPTPYDFHYSEDWREKIKNEMSGEQWKEWNDTVRTDPDLAAHITVTLHRGIVLYGRPINDVFPPVPEEHYIDSIVKDFEWGKDRLEQYPANFILNSFRVCAFLGGNRIYSKEEAGAWALSSLGDDFRELVSRALEVYRGQRKQERFDNTKMARFAEYMTERIGALLQARTTASK